MNWDMSTNIVIKHEAMFTSPVNTANAYTLETIHLKTEF